MTRAIDGKKRIGIGKHADMNPSPWYVTVYSRDLALDRVWGWYETFPECVAKIDEIVSILGKPKATP